MKTLFAGLVACMLSTAAFGQDYKKGSDQGDTSKRAQTEYYMMRDGAFWHYHDTTSRRLNMDITLENGVVITRDGYVVTKDGKRTKINSGQCVDYYGNVTRCDRYNRKDIDVDIDD